MSIELYRHPLGTETGRIELVIPSTQDPDDVVMICRSERARDTGVIYPVTMNSEDHEDMCRSQDVPHAMGCILESDHDELQLIQVPATSPQAPPDRVAGSNVRVIRSSPMWTHQWGRCCCVKHDGDLTAITTKAILAGQVPWWGSPFTPYQLDLIAAVSDPENSSMHVLVDDERVCGRCGHEVWVVMDEDIPEELPEPPSDEDFHEPILASRDALSEVPWTSKMAAWTIFSQDPTNKAIIADSELPVAKADRRKQYYVEKQYERFNSCKARRGEKNVYTVKQAFYAALGSGHSGVWSDFDLEMLQLVKGLEDVDMPESVLEEADLGDDEAEEVRHRARSRHFNAEADAEAAVLDDMMDESPEDDDFIEPEAPSTSFKPKRGKANGKGDASHKALIKSAQVLQRALSDFIQALHEAGG
jgi:hypothetical protein